MKKRILTAFVISLLYVQTQAQNNTAAPADTTVLTLKAAVEYALQHSTTMLNSKADIAYAQQQVKETTAIGLPQIKGSVNFQDATELPVFVFPKDFTNPAAGTMAVRVGNKYTTIAGISANWLLADGSYFLGLKAAKQFTELSGRINVKNENDVKIDVIKSYFLVLITKENLALVDDNIATLKSLYDNTNALNKEGFTEKLDVDRLQLQLSNLEIQRNKLTDQLDVVHNLLKVKMGMPVETPVKLTDNLTSLNESLYTEDLSGTQADIKNRAEYKILEQQVLLNQLDKKRYMYGKLPNLAAFGNYQQANYEQELKFKDWYSSSYIGLALNVPIFAGFANNAKVQKAEINIIKSQNNLYSFENMAKLEIYQNRQKYIRAQQTLEQQQKNLELANKILNTTSVKYKEGVGSNLEFVTANQDLKTSQTNYLNAIFDLLNAKLELQLALGQQVKF